jgi:hypothetical protein
MKNRKRKTKSPESDWVIYDGIKMHKSLLEPDPYWYQLQATILAQLENSFEEYLTKTQQEMEQKCKCSVKIDPTQPVEIDGKVFDLVERKAPELTVEDCIGRCVPTSSGTIYQSNEKRYDGYPTEAIAEKVLLYGLLCSVAHKLNGYWKPDWMDHNEEKFWINARSGTILTLVTYSNSDGCPVFKTKELAEQAIRMFAASRFDLKKLFQ